MNKVIFFITISIIFSFSQSNQIKINETKKRIFDNSCNNPFIISGTYLNNEIYILKSQSKFYFKIHNNNKILSEIISDGNSMWNINYEYQEISIYSLTYKEKENCYLINQVFNRIENWIINDNTNLIQSNNGWVIMEESYSQYIEDCEIGVFDLETINKKYKIIGNINLIWIENNLKSSTANLPIEYTFNLDSNKFLKENPEFELIDLR